MEGFASARDGTGEEGAGASIALSKEACLMRRDSNTELEVGKSGQPQGTWWDGVGLRQCCRERREARAKAGGLEHSKEAGVADAVRTEGRAGDGLRAWPCGVGPISHSAGCSFQSK